MKRMVLAIVVLSLLAAAGSGLAAAEKSDFAGAYEALQADIEKKMAAVTSRDAYEKLMTERKSGLEGLLAAYAAEAKSDAGQLLNSRVLIDLKRYAEAEVKLDALLAKKSPLQTESKLYKAKILTETEKTGQAVPLFREIEAALPRTNDFFAVAIALAFEAPDDMVKREYSRKVIEAKDLPAKFADYRLQLVMNLASLEVKHRKIDLAKKILQDGINANPADANTKWLRASLKQLDFINKPAPAISAENWLNSGPLTLEALKGKVVIIDFWAPWCPPCRKVIPTLVRDFNSYKGQGLVIIGFTKIYGRYSDDTQNKGAVGAEEEKALIRGYVERNGLQYPIAIAAGGGVFEQYGVSGIPTMVFINRDGTIYDIQVGSGDEAGISEKIKLLLAAK